MEDMCKNYGVHKHNAISYRVHKHNAISYLIDQSRHKVCLLSFDSWSTMDQIFLCVVGCHDISSQYLAMTSNAIKCNIL